MMYIYMYVYIDIYNTQVHLADRFAADSRKVTVQAGLVSDSLIVMKRKPCLNSVAKMSVETFFSESFNSDNLWTYG